MTGRFVAATLAAAVAFGPVAVAAAGPQAVDLGTGSTLYATADTGAALTGLALIVRAGTTREGATQSGLAALAAQTILASKRDGTTLSDRVNNLGGSIDVVVGPSVVRFTIEALPSAMPAITADIASVLAAPDTSDTTVAAARDVLAAQVDDGEKNPTSVGLDMVRSSFYAGAAGRPWLGTRESLAALAPADVAAFLTAHYVRGNAFTTATGVIDAGTSAGAKALLAALPAGSEATPAIGVRTLGTEAKRVVTHRDIGVPVVLLGFAAPALGDPDFAAMLVLRAILGGVTDRADVNTGAPIERGLDVVYSYDIKPATFAIAINGALLDPSTGMSIVEAIAHNALTKPFTPDIVRRYKDTARGAWALEALTLNDRAWQIGAAITEGADPGAAQNVIAAIDRVTAADVQHAAQRYLQRYIVALVLPRSLK